MRNRRKRRPRLTRLRSLAGNGNRRGNGSPEGSSAELTVVVVTPAVRDMRRRHTAAVIATATEQRKREGTGDCMRCGSHRERRPIPDLAGQVVPPTISQATAGLTACVGSHGAAKTREGNGGLDGIRRRVLEIGAVPELISRPPGAAPQAGRARKCLGVAPATLTTGAAYNCSACLGEPA